MQETGFNVIETHSGIYKIEGKISIPVQIVVVSKLPDGEYEGLKLLAKGVKADDVIDYVEKAISTGNENVKENVKTVIEICLSANEKLGKELREAGKMGDIFKDTFRYLFEKDFANERQQGIQQGIQEGKQEGIQEGIENANLRVARDMLKKKLPISLIEEISKLSEDVIKGLAVSLKI